MNLSSSFLLWTTWTSSPRPLLYPRQSLSACLQIFHLVRYDSITCECFIIPDSFYFSHFTVCFLSLALFQWWSTRLQIWVTSSTTWLLKSMRSHPEFSHHPLQPQLYLYNWYILAVPWFTDQGTDTTDCQHWRSHPRVNFQSWFIFLFCFCPHFSFWFLLRSASLSTRSLAMFIPILCR